MSDIVKRLRAEATDNRRYEVSGTLAVEAADRIEQLEADQRDTTEEFGRLSHDLGKALFEIERLRSERDEQVRWVKDLADSLIEAEGKIGVKNARIEQLEAALRDALSYSTIGDMPVTIYENARAALEERT